MPESISQIKIISYEEHFKNQTVELLEEFYQYLIHIDPLKRLLIKPGYGEAELKKILAEIEAKEGVFYIAVINNEIAGFVTATITRQTPEDLLGVIPSSIGRVTNLYVSALNRQKGLGTTLLQKAEEYVKSKGCDVINVEVFAPNEPAQSFYAKLGYQPRKIDQIKKL
jgi:ribosomal protein S18 acetylase RimI-like enzyme